jgi:ABC-type uncharacterized transport system permease subunit
LNLISAFSENRVNGVAILGRRHMKELELTWPRVLRVWWLFMWRAVLGGFVFGGIAGFVLGFFGALAGMTMETIQLFSGALGLLIGIGWAIMVVRMALGKRYGDFRIVLVPREG